MGQQKFVMVEETEVLKHKVKEAREYLKTIEDCKLDVAPHLDSHHDKVNFTCGYVAGAKKIIKLIGGKI